MLDKDGFDKWAGNYDESLTPHLNTFPFDGYYNVLSAVSSLVDPKEGRRIIDVGIGTGLLSEELNKKGCIIHGVDFSEKMLNKATRKIPNGSFDVVDVSKDHLGKFNNDQFDAVISSYFFHHLNLEQKLSFIKRALESNLLENGKIIIADVGFENEETYHAAHEKYQDKWDDDEFYLCGNTIVSKLQGAKITAEYKQISGCAGILVCSI